MPLFGAHMSIAGGLYKALRIAEGFECDTVQLFTSSPQQWAAKPLTKSEIDAFRSVLKETKLKFPTAHDSYLINLASPDETLYQKSIAAFIEEVHRADNLGLQYLVMHPGASVGTTEEAGLARVVAALDLVHQRCGELEVKILLETTAGQGSTLGHRFEHLAAILEQVKYPKRLGMCLDTCHVHAAGYPLGTREDYTATFREFDRLIGLKWLKLFHLNDSKNPLGSRVDRHEHIGKGHIGLEAFRMLVNDERFRNRPMILETPKDSGANKEMDPINLATLRGLIVANGHPASK
jgi:deoxyribonuclease-4